VAQQRVSWEGGVTDVARMGAVAVKKFSSYQRLHVQLQNMAKPQST
jgi:hypothetical protein